MSEYGLILNSEKEAKNFDWWHNQLTDSITKYKYNRVLLADTHTYTKAKWAEVNDIPQTITDEDGNEIENPEYTNLTGMKQNKCALMITGWETETGFACPNCGEEVTAVEITDEIKLQPIEE